MFLPPDLIAHLPGGLPRRRRLDGRLYAPKELRRLRRLKLVEFEGCVYALWHLGLRRLRRRLGLVVVAVFLKDVY
jgi:hypothetical protein